MDPTLVAALILKVGVPVVTTLMEKIQKKELVSPEEWQALLGKIEKPFDLLVPEAK